MSLSETYNNVAEVHRRLHNFKLAIQFYEKSLNGLFIKEKEN